MAKDRSLHLGFLDGLRGLAGVYVLLFHEATPKLEHSGALSPPLQLLANVLYPGRHSVVFFIVLSGYSLMLPLARAGTWELVGGFRKYVWRRARRILPPYYAALVASLALIVAYNVLGSRMAGAKTVDAALGLGSIVSHLLLVHNLSFDWVYRINGPMWSVATEWQIYFLFPLLLLPLARRIGLVATTALAWVVTSAPSFLLPDEHSLWWASPWFVGSFTLGALGARLTFGAATSAEPRRELPWGKLTWLAFGVVVVLLWVDPPWRFPLIDFPISVFAFCWINACAQLTQRGASNWMLRLLQSRFLVYLGGFSYSIYLVQHPILRLSEKVFNSLRLSHDANLLAHLLLVTPVVLAVAWVFAELFERPFTVGGVLLPALKRRLASRGATGLG